MCFETDAADQAAAVQKSFHLNSVNYTIEQNDERDVPVVLLLSEKGCNGHILNPNIVYSK